MRELWGRGLPQLRYEPIEMRIRARSGGRELVDTTGARLVWEPRRVVPSYAVPVAELQVPVTAASELADLVACFDDLVDVYVDGKLRNRASDPLAASIRQEAGVA